jgi:hypothetical protein
MDKTKKILIEMLKENTGTHICDSGNAYGRHWQRNQAREFDKELATTVNFSIYNNKPEIEVVHNLYHWLAERVDYSYELTKLFNSDRFRKAVGDTDDTSYFELAEKFPDWLGTLKTRERKLKYGEPTGSYGEGNPIAINTYNEGSLLNQDICFTYFENETGSYVILSIHNGADIRGGYTVPKIFSIDESINELPIFDYSKANVFCSRKNHHETALGIKEFQEKQLNLPGVYVEDIDFDHDFDNNWYTDDGCNWYNGSCGAKQLNKMEVKDLFEDDVWESGKLCIKNGVGYCPTCGSKLEASW